MARHIDTIVRQSIIEASQRMQAEGLIIGTAGNISVRTETGMLITPSGLPYDSLQVGDICAVDSDGTPADTSQRTPSSESPLHRAAYAARDEAMAVVHFHGLYSSAASCVVDEMPVIHYYAMRLGGSIPVVKYSTFGSGSLAADVGVALTNRRAALMQNHGGVAIGRTLEEAFQNALLLEWLSRLFVTASSMGTPRELDEAEIAAVGAIYANR